MLVTFYRLFFTNNLSLLRFATCEGEGREVTYKMIRRMRYGVIKPPSQ